VLCQSEDCAAGAHFSRQHRSKAVGHGTSIGTIVPF
jgi:hypothetical protein